MEDGRLVGAGLKHASDARLASAAQAGNAAARDALILRHRGLIPRIARSYRTPGFQFEDLLQAGTIGLIRAVDRFDPGRGVRFATYATALIRGELQHYFRDHGGAVRVPRSMKELGQAAAREQARLTQIHRAPATIAVISASLGEDDARVAEALKAREAIHAVELRDDGDGVEDSDVTAAIAMDEPGFEAAELRLAIAAALPRLPIRQRRIIALRFWREMKQERIAHELGISQMQVSRLLRVALRNLAESMAR